MERPWRRWTALATVYVVWGSTYLGIKVAVRTIEPLLAAGTRFLAAAALLGVVLLILRVPLSAPPRQALSAAALGVALLGLGVGGVTVAETRIDSSVAALIAGSVPLQIVVWRTVAGERVASATVAAALGGLGGLALIVVPDGAGGGSTAAGLTLMVCSSMCWAAASFFARRLTLPAHAFTATFWEMLGGGTALIAVAAAHGDLARIDLGATGAGPAVAWLYLVVFGSLVAFTAYAWLLRAAPISQVVTHQYVNPVVAIVLGALILDERLTALTAVGAATIIAAVFVTVRSESRASARRELAGAQEG